MIYVMSDIHGHRARYESIMSQINLQPDDHLYVLGDCIDRHPDGLEILKELYYMPNATVLLGNHEHMMLQALGENPKKDGYLRLWYGNGGEVTHEAWKRYSKAQRAEVIGIIRQLPVNVEVRCNDTDYLLVHGAPLGYKQKIDDAVAASVWTRIDRYPSLPYTQTVIFGHTPTYHYEDAFPLRIYHGIMNIGIDCGCAYEEYGRLACLRLDDMREFYSEDNDDGGQDNGE